jgi:hypothetical protein
MGICGKSNEKSKYRNRWGNNRTVFIIYVPEEYSLP